MPCSVRSTLMMPAVILSLLAHFVLLMGLFYISRTDLLPVESLAVASGEMSRTMNVTVTTSRPEPKPEP
ncbi:MULTISPECIES: hypothetical protein, partial [unclassified Neptuniibacter]|uniref:hypothetical protein n=1 Tax=unclassified Neptuniibacter TaxID=2630693 RepID=UPI0025DB74F9